MSTLLAEGGFPLEALSPLGQAVELALKASAYSAGEDGAGSEEELSLALIQSRIIPAGSLPDNAVAIGASLRESAQKADLTHFISTLSLPKIRELDKAIAIAVGLT